MSLVGLADRVNETSTTTGTGTITLGGAETGYRTFIDTIGDGAPCSYVIAMGSSWETGVGLVHTPNYLSRQTVLSSSNSNSLVDFGAGTKNVFISELAAFQDAALFTAGESLSVRDVVCVALTGSGSGSTTAGRVYKANATLSSRSVESLVAGFCVHAASTGGPVLVKKFGMLPGFTGLTAGAPYYISVTGGAITATQPANARVIGVAVSSTELFINTELDFKFVLNTNVTSTELGFLGPGLSTTGSVAGSFSRNTAAEYIDLKTDTGNSASLGTMSLGVTSYGNIGSATDVFTAGGARGTSSITLETAVQVCDRYVASTSVTDEGDLTQARAGLAGVSNTTRGFVCGGKYASGQSNVIDMITYSTWTNASSDAGDLLLARSYVAGASSSNSAFIAGGENTTMQSLIDQINLATGTQNGTDRGDLVERKRSACGIAGTFATFCGGFTGVVTSNLEAVDLFTLSVIAMDRGELVQSRCSAGSASGTTKGVVAGGYNGVEMGSIESILTATVTTNAFDRGDLANARAHLSGQ